LWRNIDFQLLWVGSTASFLGVEAADVAYPLAVLALTGSAAKAGLFGVVLTLATLLAGLPAGVVADRFARRRVLVIAEVVRALGSVSVVVALVGHWLTLVHLLVVAAVLGAAMPFGATARMLLVRAVVPAGQLTAALSQEQVRDGVSQLAGPPLGGFLYGVRQQLPFLFSAVTFVVSLVCALVIRVPETRVPDPAHAQSGLLLGIRIIWRDSTLRAATLLVAALNTVGAPIVLVATVILQRQSVRPLLIGVALAGFAVGGLVGATLVTSLHRRLQPGVLLLGVVGVEVPLVWCLGLPFGPWWMAAVLVAAGIGIPALQVLVDVLIFRQVPDEQRGRVIAAVMTLFGLGMPVGTALAGVLLQYLSPAHAMLVLSCALLCAVGYAASRPRFRAARWPR
jgi:MFS family permease